MLLGFWEGFLWSAPSRYYDVHKWGEWFPSSLPSSPFSWKKAVRLWLFPFSDCSLKRLGLQWNLVALSLPPCPDHSNCSSSSTQRKKESSRNGWGQCQPNNSVLPSPNAVTSNHPYAFTEVEKRLMSFYKFQIHQPLSLVVVTPDPVPFNNISVPSVILAMSSVRGPAGKG